MSIFIDTSAFLAILNPDDKNHQEAKKRWEELLLQDEKLVCSNYVLVETMALIQNRFGMEALRAFQEDVVPILAIKWVDEFTHQAGITSMLTANRRKLSFVDCVSFDIMRQLGIKRAFAFDRHFEEQGFECIP